MAFSCTSQPGLANARWLPFWMVCDSLLMGCGVNAIVAFIFGDATALHMLWIPTVALAGLRMIGFMVFFANVKRRVDECYKPGFRYGVPALVVIGSIGMIIGSVFSPLAVFISGIVTVVISLVERYWMILMIRHVPDGSVLIHEK